MKDFASYAWLTRSLDLTVSDFFCGGMLKILKTKFMFHHFQKILLT